MFLTKPQHFLIVLLLIPPKFGSAAKFVGFEYNIYCRSCSKCQR